MADSTRKSSSRVTSLTRIVREIDSAAATDGLTSRIIGNLQFGFGKGLIGRVAESRQPVNLDRVPELDQSFLEQTGTKHYRGFVGVPVIHKGQVQGVREPL